MAIAGMGLGACGASQALSLSASEHLGPTVHGRPGTALWCQGVEQTAESLVGLGRGESTGIAARIVRNDVKRLVSAVSGLDNRSAAAPFQEAEHTARTALTELRDGEDAGLTEAGSAASQVTQALTRLQQSAGVSC